MNQIAIRRNGKFLKVVDGPEAARTAIREAHDGLDGEGGHPFYLASNSCGCQLTMADLLSLDATTVWEAGLLMKNGWRYWSAQPVAITHTNP